MDVTARDRLVTPTDDERSTFTNWVAPHWRAMFALAYRIAGPTEHEDILQESLTLAWRKRCLYDVNRGTTRAWLLALVLDAARRRRRHYASRASEVVVGDLETFDQPLAPFSRDLDLDAAIRRLSSRQRAVIELYYFVDLPLREIAAVMRCSEGTVKSTLSDARKALAATLGDRHG